jgi:sarcosine oxidase
LDGAAGSFYISGMGTRCEAIVVGCGGPGSAALYWLSKELGSDVLGHDRDASQDHSRIIRLAQHLSRYAALAPRAHEAFHEIEEASDVRVLFKTGGRLREGFPRVIGGGRWTI